MKIVYICHPIGGDVEGNLKKIREIVRRINYKLPNVIPFVPYYADVVSLDDNNPHDRALGMRNNMYHLQNCNEVWVLGNDITEGMVKEIDRALHLGKIVKVNLSMLSTTPDPIGYIL